MINGNLCFDFENILQLRMEFAVKFDCDSTTLALLGTGSSGSSGIATSSGDNRILNTNNTIGGRNLAFTKGEWCEISVF